MRDGFSIYDTHTHIGVARHSGRNLTAGQLLAAMDRTGVDRAVLIPFPVVEDYRASHDEIGRALRTHPDRFTGAACIYPFLPVGSSATRSAGAQKNWDSGRSSSSRSIRH